MDPNAALAQMREIAREYFDTEEELDLDEFISLFDALDAWMTKGGFLPAAWREYRS